MHSSEARRGWQHSWVVGLALLSVAVPVAAIVLHQEPVLPLTHPAHLRYYRQTVAALVPGMACAVGMRVLGKLVFRSLWRLRCAQTSSTVLRTRYAL